MNTFIKYLISNNDFYLRDTNKSELFEKNLLEYNININEFKNYINKYFKKYKKEFLKIINGMKKTNKIEKNYNFIKMNEGNKLIIGIYSSLFEIIYNSNIIDELFIIDIYSDYIYTKNSLDKYTSNFHKLNNNLNISSIKINFDKGEDINYLKDLNINQLKYLKIEPNPFYFDTNRDNINNLFLLKNIENSLIDLNITIEKYSNRYEKLEIDENIIENLNKFKVLKNLTLIGFNSKKIFELKINSLKALDIRNCKNIYINIEQGLFLKKLIIFQNEKFSKSLLKLPQLEYLKLNTKKIDQYNDTISYMRIEDLYIDFMSLNNLKRLAVNSYIFQKFKNLSLLEYAKIYDNINIECLKKILSIKSLKEIDIESIELEKNNINLNDKISNISGDNKNISKLYIRYEVDNECIISDKLVNIFPNLTAYNIIYVLKRIYISF